MFYVYIPILPNIEGDPNPTLLDWPVIEGLPNPVVADPNPELDAPNPVLVVLLIFKLNYEWLYIRKLVFFIYPVVGWPNTVFWLENNDGVFDRVLLTANGLAGGEKLVAGWDGLHACCPKSDMLPNADPGELNPKEVWPNDDGWLAAAATDPNSPLDAGVVDGEPNIDVVVLVAAGVPKIDVVVDVEPNNELDEVGTDGLPNIDELVEAGEPNTVAVWVEDPKPLVFVVADPKIEDVVVADGEPNKDEAVVFIELPKIDWVDVEVGVPKIEDIVVTLVFVPNMEDAVVTFVGAPNTEGTVLVSLLVAGISKTADVLVALVGVLKIEVPVELVGELNIVEALVVFKGVLKIEGVLAELVEILNIDFGSVVLVVQSKIDEVAVEVIDVSKTVALVDGIPNTGVMVANVGAFSLSGVTGSDTIGVGLSEIWGVDSVTTLLLGTTEGRVLTPLVVLTFPMVEDIVGEPTDSVTTVERVFAGSEKLNDDNTAVAGVDVDVKKDLVSGNVVGLETSSLGTEKLKDENDVVSGFELKLKDIGVSFAGTVSCIIFDLPSAESPENIPGVSKGLDNTLGTSNLKLLNGVFFGSLILFLIESEKLKVDELVFGTVVSILAVETLVKLKGVFSFDSVLLETISKVDFVETVFRGLLKLKGTAVDGFKLKSTGFLLDVSPVALLIPNTAVELVALKTTPSFGIVL